MAKRVLAFDFGASSGRAIIASLQDGKIKLDEIHRFPNDPIEVDGTLCWDIKTLNNEVKIGIKKAVAAGGFDSIGIDTWGVDFGLIDDNGDLISPPVHYRDPRTNETYKRVFNKISQDDLYKRAGIQCMRFNTIYQLAYLCEYKPELIEKTNKIIMMADLFAYFLTRKMFIEETNASTTNFLNPNTGNWDKELCDIVGIPTRILPSIIKPGESYGTITKELADELGCGEVPVIAVATHDTASAIVSVPACEKDFIYISCGTWSLFGTELDKPIINEKSINADFTNEGGYNSTTFHKNIIGLWLIQESRREWKRQGKAISFMELEQEAVNAMAVPEAERFVSFINPDHPSFELPGDLPEKIREFCRNTNQAVPQSVGEIMKCIYQSLAMKYRHTIKSLEKITGKKYSTIHMVGGGIKDQLLCQLTASACNVTVKAGPIEATATGNAAVQFIALNEIDGIESAREIISQSTQLKIFTPTQSEDWDKAYEKYLRII